MLVWFGSDSNGLTALRRSAGTSSCFWLPLCGSSKFSVCKKAPSTARVQGQSLFFFSAPRDLASRRTLWYLLVTIPYLLSRRPHLPKPTSSHRPELMHLSPERPLLALGGLEGLIRKRQGVGGAKNGLFFFRLNLIRRRKHERGV